MKKDEKEVLNLDSAVENEINRKDDAKRTEMELKKKEERGVELPQRKVHAITNTRKGGKNIDPLNQNHKERGNLDSGSGSDKAHNRFNK